MKRTIWLRTETKKSQEYKAAGIPKTGRFVNIDSAVIISTALLTLLMRTAESTMSKLPVLRMTLALLFLLDRLLKEYFKTARTANKNPDVSSQP